MASGRSLPSADGPVRIDHVEPGDDAEAYNLVIADFSTYFVGDAGLRNARVRSGN